MTKEISLQDFRNLFRLFSVVNEIEVIMTNKFIRIYTDYGLKSVVKYVGF